MEVLEHLHGRGVDFLEVADLCELAAKKKSELVALARSPGLHIVACYPRALKWLFSAANAPLDETAVIFNMRDQSGSQIADALAARPFALKEDAANPASGPHAKETIDYSESSKDGWLPWFPVIDFDRCTQCMQCLSFCLFNVFGVSADRKILVENPENCKPNCPACARVCPQTAILFPKHKSSPINGDIVSASNAETKTKVDISSFLGGDMYRFLRDRNERESSRFSKDRDPQTALEERRKCLAQLQQLGDIPPEVLMSLPSESEMKQRADAAAERARKAIHSS
jgi:Pyruvate/2-oxoacid:ferredoxin oxidoreductase delta subunit